ncbi:MAG: DUF1704 domain-containing protein [Alphaproteobacteria bacterium]|nr:DUF1704 domain-containing protein [Alphaproteobacteria bacterium]MCB9793961.1 DUF1704 domain-containing protein [Alphaproteobacteria bacterium]
MTPDELPRDLRAVDDALFALYERVAFNRFLNPRNAPEARSAFLKGAKAPPFEYHPATWADEELRRLDQLTPPMDHPLGPMMADAVEGSRLFIVALRDRTPEAFDALARHSGWYPDARTLAQARSEVQRRDDAPFVVRAREMIEALQRALDTRGLHRWRIEEDSVMAARVMVDGAKRMLRVNPSAHFRRSDLKRLVVHEVDVHAVRSENGRGQPLHVFSTGLPGSLETEEGLALVAEAEAGAASPGTMWRQGVVAQAVDWARELGFRELHQRITREAGSGLAWGVSLRLKRGLADPSKPGVYAKDIVYYRGTKRVQEWRAAGNPIELLYVGKVGVDDPVQEWIDQGLLARRPVPPVFRGGLSA